MTVLPRRSPSEQGVDPQTLLDLVDTLDRSDHELHSLMILRGGAVVTEGWWAPFRPDLPHALYSLSKSFTSVAVGLAVDAGLLDLDDQLVDLFPDLGPQPPDPRVAAITLRHALTMTTGHDTDPILTLFPWIVENPRGDWLDGFLGLAPDHAPGAPFTYNQLATYAAARAVEARTGQRLVDHLREPILEPLGAHDAHWMNRGGHDLGFAGLHLRTESIAAFGELCLRKGRFGGRRLVPASWIEAATSALVPNDLPNRGAGDQNPEPDWNAGYGYQFWQCRHGFRGDGALGQFCIVWPDEDMVIVTTAATPDMQGLLDLFEERLSGALEFPDRHDTGEIEDRLARRCAELALPTPVHHPSGPPISGTFGRAGGSAAPSMQTVEVTEHGSGWRFRIDQPGAPVTVDVEPDRWIDGIWSITGDRRDLPAAGTAGRRPDGTLHAEIGLVTTPHRLLLDVDPEAGTFTVDWNEFPLHGAEPADLSSRD